MTCLRELLLRPDAATAVSLSSIGMLVAAVVLALNPPVAIQHPDNHARAALAKPELKAIPIFVRAGRVRDR